MLINNDPPQIETADEIVLDIVLLFQELFLREILYSPVNTHDQTILVLTL